MFQLTLLAHWPYTPIHLDCFIQISFYYVDYYLFKNNFPDSESTHSFKTAQTVTTPPILRPDALFLSKSSYSPNTNFVSI